MAAFALLYLVGMNTRTVLLSVPPILPQIQSALGLSHTSLGLLSALPALVMGLAALPAGLLAGRLGGRRTVALGLAVLAAGAALRAVWPATLPLFLFTAILSFGIGLAQTAIVSLVRTGFPTRIGLATALYTDGIISGEALGAGLTLPLVLGVLGAGAWRASFVAWSIPVVGVLALWILLAPADEGVRDGGARGAKADTARTMVAGRPLWLMALHLGLLSGSGSLIYFSMNAWTASFNAALGHSAVSAASLAILNASQLPVALAITPLAQRLTGRRLPFLISGVLCLVAMGGWAWTPVAWQPAWAGLFGGSTVAVLLLGLALGPYFADRTTVGRLVGGALTGSYLLSFSGQVIGGRLWDLAGKPIFAFLPVIAASLALIALGALIPSRV
jgi:MFS transporter, CP family, cyanate transporter